MATVANIDVGLRARTRKFQKGMKRAGKSVGAFRASALKLAGTLAAGLGLRALVSSISNTIDKLDTLVKTARKLDIDVNVLRGLRFAAEQSGTSIGVLDSSLKKLTVRLGEAKEGTGEAISALAKLGLSAGFVAGLPVKQALFLIADQMLKVKSQTDKATIAYDLFGRAGQELLVMLEQGSAGLREFIAESEKLSGILDKSAEKAIENTADSINRISKSWDSFFERWTTFWAPRISKTLDDITKTMTPADVGGAGIRVGGQTFNIEARRKEIERREREIAKAVRASKTPIPGMGLNPPGPSEGLIAAQKELALLKRVLKNRIAALEDFRRIEREEIATTKTLQALDKTRMLQEEFEAASDLVRVMERQNATLKEQERLTRKAAFRKRVEDSAARAKAFEDEKRARRKGIAKSIEDETRRLRTPLEILNDEIERLEKLRDKGLGEDIFARGIKQAQEQFERSTKALESPTPFTPTGGVAAAQRGTQAAASLIARIERKQQDDQLREQKKANKIAEDSNDALKTIATNTGSVGVATP